MPTSSPTKLRPDGVFRPWIADELYLATTTFRFLGLTPLNNHCVLIPIPETSEHSAHLLVWNPVELTPELLSSLRHVESETGLKVQHLFSGLDYHHFALPAWQTEFPQARLSVVSERIVDKQPTLNAEVLDEYEPSLGDTGGTLEVLPVAGYLGPLVELGKKWRDGRRCELLSYHRPTRTLLVGDLLFCTHHSSLLQRILLRQSAAISWNRIGFRLHDRAAARRFVDGVLARPIDRMLCVHGTFLVEGEQNVRDAMSRVLPK